MYLTGAPYYVFVLRDLYFTRYGIRYSTVHWVELLRLEQHWVKSTVEARLVDPPGGAAYVKPAASTALLIDTVRYW